MLPFTWVNWVVTLCNEIQGSVVITAHAVLVHAVITRTHHQFFVIFLPNIGYWFRKWNDLACVYSPVLGWMICYYIFGPPTFAHGSICWHTTCSLHLHRWIHICTCLQVNWFLQLCICFYRAVLRATGTLTTMRERNIRGRIYQSTNHS